MLFYLWRSVGCPLGQFSSVWHGAVEFSRFHVEATLDPCKWGINFFLLACFLQMLFDLNMLWFVVVFTEVACSSYVRLNFGNCVGVLHPATALWYGFKGNSIPFAVFHPHWFTAFSNVNTSAKAPNFSTTKWACTQICGPKVWTKCFKTESPRWNRHAQTASYELQRNF